MEKMLVIEQIDIDGEKFDKIKFIGYGNKCADMENEPGFKDLSRRSLNHSSNILDQNRLKSETLWQIDAIEKMSENDIDADICFWNRAGVGYAIGMIDDINHCLRAFRLPKRPYYVVWLVKNRGGFDKINKIFEAESIDSARKWVKHIKDEIRQRPLYSYYFKGEKIKFSVRKNYMGFYYEDPHPSHYEEGVVKILHNPDWEE